MESQEEKKESTSIGRPLPDHDTSNFTAALSLSLSNARPEDDLTAYSPPEGGLVAWMAGK
jgi:hypothetical protein